MALEAGTNLGPYEILSPLGAGGMGEVYRAKDTRLDREVAVKVLPKQFATDPTALSRFEREARAVAALSHPNVLAVYDVGREGKTSYVVTELLEGETLRQRLNAEPLPWRKAVEIAVAVVDGLAAAHAKGIVHRDLKPENIFLTTDGVVKILDFGLARMTPDQSGAGQDIAHTPTVTIETRPGTVIGTLNYMSPEQLRGLATDARSDVFSFGCVLYEMVAGRRAFRGETSADTMTAILRETPTSVRNEIADVGVELERVIERCLEKRAEQRFHSASDLAFTLKAILADSGSSQAARDTGHHRDFAIPVATAAIVLLAIGGWLLVRSWTATPKDQATVGEIRSIAVLPFDNLSNDPAQQVYVDVIWESITDDLAKIGAIQVTSSHTLRYYREQNMPMSEIEAKLDVDAFVTGSALHAGSRVEIRVRLVRTEDNRQLWSNHYEFDKRDILSEQRKVARAVADEIKIELSPAEHELLASAPRIVPAAYDAYVRGVEKLRPNTRESGNEALALFDQALNEDPDFALAHVGRARAYIQLANDFIAPREAMPQARSAALQALAIDDSLADAHVVLGKYRLEYEWDFDGAREEFEQALQLRPSLAKAHLGYALYLSAMDRGPEALQHLNAVQELDRASLYTDNDHGWVSFMARDYSRTIRDAKAALAIDKNWWAAHCWLAEAYSQRGKHDDAVAHARKAQRLNPAPGNTAMMGGVLAVAGRREEAQAIYDELKVIEPEQYICPYELAVIPLGLGDFDTTFHEMDRACEARADCLAWLQPDPRLDPIRDDPRFDRLLMRVGFEPKGDGLRVLDERSTESTTLAVFPFDDNSPQPQAWLAAGLAQQISARLGRVSPKKLRVIGPESSAYYAASGKPLGEVAQDLNADLVLRGAIQIIDNDVRITARLIDPADLTPSWSATFKGTLDDPFALQTQVAEKTVSGLPFELTGAETQRLQKKYTTNPEAELAYMQGRFWWHEHTRDSFEKAIAHFDRAIELDSQYALAYAGLANAYATFTSWNANPVAAIRDKATQAARRALELDDSLAEAHTSVGVVAQFLEWDWGGAEAAYHRAIQLNPDYYLAHHMYAHLLVMLGRESEAIVQFEQAARAEPISPFNSACFGAMYVGLGRVADGERLLRQALEWNNEYGLALFYLGYTLQLRGRFDEAIETHERACRLQPDAPFYRAALGSTYAAAGRTDDARRVLAQLDELSNRVFVGQMDFAKVYAGLGDKDEAFRRLEAAYEGREPWLPQIRFEPGYDNLKSDPRFGALHRRMGLAHVELPAVPR